MCVYMYILHTHTYNEILLSHKKNEILPFATAWMALEDIMLQEIESVKDKYRMISLFVESNKETIETDS